MAHSALEAVICGAAAHGEAQHHHGQAVDALHPRSYPERLNVGLEYSFNKLAHLRIGYLDNYDERNLTYGFGIAMGSLKIDYALTPFGVFDSVNRLSIGISI